jgi:hypothetical protein
MADCVVCVGVRCVLRRCSWGLQTSRLHQPPLRMHCTLQVEVVVASMGTSLPSTGGVCVGHHEIFALAPFHMQAVDTLVAIITQALKHLSCLPPFAG